MTARRPQPGVPREYAFPEIVRATLANGLSVAVARMPISDAERITLSH